MLRPDSVGATPDRSVEVYYYVYILRSESRPNEKYISYTKNLEARLKKHNEGGTNYTKAYRPWKIETAIAFTEKEKALKFEKYLKSHSGRAFASKHFLRNGNSIKLDRFMKSSESD